MRVHLFACACVCALSAPDAFGGFGVITDPTFFDPIPHTLIDFETRHDGTPVVVPEGGDIPMSFGEYSTLGVSIFGAPNWANFTSDDLETIQAAHATPDNSLAMLPVFPGDPVGFNLFPHVRSWGIFIMMDIGTPTLRPEFDFADENGDIITTLVFDESFVQGRVGDIEFGFLGYTSDEPFGAVVMRNFTRPAFDDLRFSAFPAPGPGAALALTALGAGLRRRRTA